METDHTLLLAIFSKSLIGCPPRIQRFRLRLQKYGMKLMYTADTLSRAPLEIEQSSTEEEVGALVHVTKQPCGRQKGIKQIIEKTD